MTQRSLYFVLLSLTVVGLLAPRAIAQPRPSSPAPESGARIAGRVTVDGKPAGGVLLMLYSPINGPTSVAFTLRNAGKPRARTTSDADGHYAFNGLQAGSYLVHPFSPLLAPPPAHALLSAGKTVSVEDAESIEGIDIALHHGGVIGGVVRRADGQPAIETSVWLIRNDNESNMSMDMATGQARGLVMTDDQGAYRIFGLSPGAYTVYALQHNGPSFSSYRPVFYPGVTDQALATAVSLSGGEEINNVDIVLGKEAVTHDAVGQAVDADTGMPLSGVMFCYRIFDEAGRTVRTSAQNPADRTNENGQFRISGLTDGHYAAFLRFEQDQSYYSEAAPFTISGGDVDGIQVKGHSACVSVAGTVEAPGTNDPRIAQQLPQITLQISSDGAGVPGGATSAVRFVNPAADGQFQASGFPPGALSFRITGDQPKGFLQLGVEHNGAPVGAINATTCGQINSVRIMLAYGTAVLRGQVMVEGNELPVGAEIWVRAQPLSGYPNSLRGVADARGRFEIDGLPDGQYRVSVSALGLPTGQIPQSQIVIVNGGKAPEVNLVMELGGKK